MIVSEFLDYGLGPASWWRCQAETTAGNSTEMSDDRPSRVMFRRLLMLKQPALMLQCRASVCILRNPHQSLQPRAFGDIEDLRALLSAVGFHCGVGGCTEALSAQTSSFISGYLITGLLIAELAATGRIDLFRFDGRRAPRLLPRHLW